MKKIKAIVWDIGGVLLEDPKIGDFWRGIKETKKLREAFGEGKLKTNQFISRGSKLIGLDKKTFLEQYKKTYFSIKPINDVLKIYNSLKIKKYIFSDTNPLHMNFILKNYPKIFNSAEKCFLTPKMSCRKSNQDSFSKLIKGIGIKPEEILFIDNKLKFVEKARVFGINSIQFENISKLKKDLKKFDIK